MSEGTGGVFAEHTWNSFCMHSIYENRRHCIKCLKMVVETSDKNFFSYFYALNNFLRLTRPDRTRPLRSLAAFIPDSIIDTGVNFWHKVKSSLKIVLSNFGTDIFNSLETMCFLALLKFRQFSAVFFVLTFHWKRNVSNSNGFIGNIFY